MAQRNESEKRPTPLKEFSAGSVTLTAWKNDGQENGRSPVAFTMKKSYRGQDQQWHDTTSLFPMDLLALASVATEAFQEFGIRVTMREKENFVEKEAKKRSSGARNPEAAK